VQKLVQGIHTFQQEVFEAHRALFERLAGGQKPEALFITCSDSRINPALLTQTSPGELFILRNAGNIVPPHGASSNGEAATIEYAVSVLGVTDLIVCGHSGCGAVQALFDPALLERLPSMRDWLRHADATCRIVHDNYGHLEGDLRLTAAIEENVLVQLEHVRTLPSVASALAGRRLKLHAWVYKIETGEVFAYDPADGQYSRLTTSTPVLGIGRTI
jgi:carbonic anhydrase